MALGNLHPHPTDPTKTIRTGHANVPFEWDLKNDLRYYGFLAILAVGSFLANRHDISRNASTAADPAAVVHAQVAKPAALPQP